MNILILSSPNPLKTSGIVAFNLLEGLTQNGHNVKLAVKTWDKYNDDRIIPLDTPYQGLIDKSRRRILRMIRTLSKSKRRIDENYSIQDYDQRRSFLKNRKLNKLSRLKPDIIIAVFMQNMVSFKDLYKLQVQTKANVILYIMDMAPFTGACHYAWDCRNYQKNCGNCPALYSNNENDQTRKNWEFKKKYIDKTKLTVIAASEGQFQQLLKSSLFQLKDKHKVLLGLDENIFNVSDKISARKLMKLPQDKTIIFFGAVNINSKRKGYFELIEILNHLYNIIEDSSKIYIAIAGGFNNALHNMLPFEHTFLGYLDYWKLAYTFQASDVFLSPSIEDSGPMMVNQSIMCGTPVVSFDIGVAIDLVKSRKTGYLSQRGDTIGFAKGIKEIINLDSYDYSIMSENCLNLGLEKCSLQKQANEILKTIL